MLNVSYAPSGSQTSGPGMLVPANPSRATPTTVNCSPLMRTSRPSVLRTGAELLPERIADDRHADPGAGPFLFRGEGASMRRRRTEHLEVVAGHRGCIRAPRPVAGIQTDEACGGGRQARKDVGRAFLEIAVVRVGEVPRSSGRRRSCRCPPPPLRRRRRTAAAAAGR